MDDGHTARCRHCGRPQSEHKRVRINTWIMDRYEHTQALLFFCRGGPPGTAAFLEPATADTQYEPGSAARKDEIGEPP